METNIYQSDLAIHPGELLEETLEEIAMSQAELANRLGRPLQAINEIIKGKKSITPKTALELEDVLNVPAHIWVGLEAEYQMIKAKEEEQKQMQEESALLSLFPYLELSKLDLVQKTRDVLVKVDELRRFFSVAKLTQIEHVKSYQPAFRVTNKKTVSHEAIAAWLQAGKIKAETIETQPFDHVKLKTKLPELKTLMHDNIEDATQKIRQLLAECGVAFVMLPHFKHTHVNGATFWLNSREKAVIMMSLKGGFSDIFWFSFFHEIGHILLHGKRELFLEDGHCDPALQKQEDEADMFAKDLLILPKAYSTFLEQHDFSKQNILSFSKQMKIKPSIIVGRLMYEKIVPFNDYRLCKLRDSYKWAKE